MQLHAQVLWPLGAFNPSIPGVPTITREPTPVPINKRRAITSKANKAGVTLAYTTSERPLT